MQQVPSDAATHVENPSWLQTPEVPSIGGLHAEDVLPPSIAESLQPFGVGVPFCQSNRPLRKLYEPEDQIDRPPAATRSKKLHGHPGSASASSADGVRTVLRDSVCHTGGTPWRRSENTRSFRTCDRIALDEFGSEGFRFDDGINDTLRCEMHEVDILPRTRPASRPQRLMRSGSSRAFDGV